MGKVIKPTLSGLIPEKVDDTVLVQAKVSKELVLPVRAELDRRGASWNDFVKAACQSFLSELEANKNGKK